MGYAVIMFTILLLMALAISLSANYGMSNDSEKASLLAENAYAEMEAGKGQTNLIILNTCIKPLDTNKDRYVNALGNELSALYSFNLTVKNNGSIVLNSSKTTIIYLSRNTSNQTVIYDTSSVGLSKSNNNVWAPLTNASLNSSASTIFTPNTFGGTVSSKNPWDELRLLVAAENGIVTIPPTSAINFTGIVNTITTKISFSWNASYDEDGIAYYRLYVFDAFERSASTSRKDTGYCPPRPYTIIQIPGNATFYSWNYSANPYLNLNTSICVEAVGCDHDGFYLTAIDNLGNEGAQSRTIDCHVERGNNYICSNPWA